MNGQQDEISLALQMMLDLIALNVLVSVISIPHKDYHHVTLQDGVTGKHFFSEGKTLLEALKFASTERAETLGKWS